MVEPAGAGGGGGPESWLESAKSCARLAIEFEGVGQLPVAVYYYTEAARLLRAVLSTADKSDSSDTLQRYQYSAVLRIRITLMRIRMQIRIRLITLIRIRIQILALKKGSNP